MVIFKLEVGPFIEAIAPDGMISLSESIIHIVALLLVDAQGKVCATHCSLLLTDGFLLQGCDEAVAHTLVAELTSLGFKFLLLASGPERRLLVIWKLKSPLWSTPKFDGLWSVSQPIIRHSWTIFAMIPWPLVRGFNPLKNISQLGWLFPTYGKIKNVPNHQPGSILGVGVGKKNSGAFFFPFGALRTFWSGTKSSKNVRKRSGVKITVQDLSPELGKIDRFWLWCGVFLRSRGSGYNSFTGVVVAVVVVVVVIACWLLVVGSWLLAVGCWLLVAGCWLLVVGCWLLAVGCWLLVAGCWLLAVGCWLLVVGCWLLAVGCWLLAVGCWLLVVGCWLLAVGCWLLVVGCCR